MITKVLACDVFRCGVLLCVGPFDELPDTLRANGSEVSASELESIKTRLATSTGFCLSDGDNGESVIYAQLPMPITTLVHEICHATRKMLDDKGVDDDEAFAYTAEHLLAQAISLGADVVQFPSSPDCASPRRGKRTSPSPKSGEQSRSCQPCSHLLSCTNYTKKEGGGK